MKIEEEAALAKPAPVSNSESTFEKEVVSKPVNNNRPIGLLLVVVVLGIGAWIAIQATSLSNPTSTVSSSTSSKVAEVTEVEINELKGYLDQGDIASMRSLISVMPAIRDPDLLSEFRTIQEAAFTLDAEKIASEISATEESYEDALEHTANRLRTSLRAFRLSENGALILEPAILELVRPIPASDAASNQVGYELLSLIAPTNDEYVGKVAEYKAKAVQQLEQARLNEKAALERERRNILSNYRKNEDQFQKTTFYRHVNSPRYVNSRSTIYLYLGESSGRWFTRMEINYTADDWLFVKKVTTLSDGKVDVLISGDHFDFDRDHDAGEIWEWLDVSPSATHKRILKSMSEANNAIIRFEGSTYRKDVRMGPNDKAALRAVLRDFDRLKEISAELKKYN